MFQVVTNRSAVSCAHHRHLHDKTEEIRQILITRSSTHHRHVCGVWDSRPDRSMGAATGNAWTLVR